MPTLPPLSGNMLIAQSGGPTAVINQTLVGAVLEARNHPEIKKVFGAMHGIQGILDENFVDLGKETPANLERVAQTPSSALGSVRKKPTAEDCAAIFEVLRKNDIRYFFYIGGNDSAETTHIIHEHARKAKFEFRCFHLCKTIDNDLRQNDHTPGFGSAAKFVACAFMGDNQDNRALGGVKINIIMGRHAGFLTAASALARVYPDDGPHLIYLPERPFSMDQFCEDVKKVMDKTGRCVVAVSEGVCDGKGTPIIAAFTKEVDSHGNIQLSGNGALGDLLADELKKRTGIRRVRADTFGYLQRSFPGLVSETDAAEAREVGASGVRFSVKEHENGSVAIQRKKTKKYGVDFVRVPLKSVAKDTRHMPAAHINKAGNDVTKAFVDYVTPIVGKLPEMGRLKNHPVK
ncbi:MAG: 6-phosphofructokinase [Verrucomicrobia bacterium]|nr:6-phosphofructokinase [Verrucomicrobiota bacterium]MCH8510529.1 6-phosphofructokinase [Kiritimatiellia bacterium]